MGLVHWAGKRSPTPWGISPSTTVELSEAARFASSAWEGEGARPQSAGAVGHLDVTVLACAEI